MISMSVNLGLLSQIKNLYGSRGKEKGITEIGYYLEESLKLESVKYEKKPPKVNVFYRLTPKLFYSDQEDHADVPSLLSGEVSDKKEDDIGLIKFSDWSYKKKLELFFQLIWNTIRIESIESFSRQY